MGKFEGPFGMPTPERVFAQEREKKYNTIEIASFCNSNNSAINDLYDYCDELWDNYEFVKKKNKSLKKHINTLQNKINTIIEENKKLNERMDKLEKSHLINPIRRI